MEFALANIWQDFKSASQTEYGSVDDNGNEVILGPRLNEAVRHWANGYLKHLELGPENKATTERAKLLDLHWGRIEQDGAQLRGLGAALTSFAGILGENVTKLADRWQGESYDAFKAAMDKVQRTLSEYGAEATTTGEGLVNAMSHVREIYQTFADDSANVHLNFGKVSHPDQWHRMTDHEAYSGFELAEACSTTHGMKLDCLKNNDEQRNIITGHFVTEKRWAITKSDPCEEDAGRVIIMYRNMVDECEKQIGLIKEKLGFYFGAVNTAVEGASGLYGAAVGNVYKLANAEVFSSLRVIGGQPVGGGAPVDSGTPTGDVGYPAGGDTGPVAVAEPMPPAPEPEPAPVEDTALVDAVAQEPPPATEPPPVDQPESVQIKDGDRTIGVTSPDGEGHVRVTVEDGTGATKTYELDFNAASGLVAPTLGGVEASADATAEQVPARTDGKCVIQDGPLTITAERPLFSPDSIKLVVDDGSGNPATYTLDFPEQDTTDPNEQQPAAQSTPDTPAAGPVDTSASVSAETPVIQGPPAPAQTPATQESAAPGQEPVVNGSPAPAASEAVAATEPVPAGQLTSPQVWHGDQTGSVSGVLVPDQSSGEAGLAKAPDAARPDVTGMAGAAGVPATGGPPSGGSDSGRAGSGWSVHGDLFDSGEPVYSMHGVLGDDERTTE